MVEITRRIRQRSKPVDQAEIASNKSTCDKSTNPTSQFHATHPPATTTHQHPPSQSDPTQLTHQQPGPRYHPPFPALSTSVASPPDTPSATKTPPPHPLPSPFHQRRQSSRHAFRHQDPTPAPPSSQPVST